MPDERRVHPALRARLDEIRVIMHAITAEQLNAEYYTLCERMSVALALKRPSPLKQGEARTWAAAIIHATGWVNFLTDPAQEPHMTTAQLASASGVGKNSLMTHSRTVRDALGLVQFDPDWTLPSELGDNPLAWMIDVNGVVMDARQAPPDIQLQAVQQGAIPFHPRFLQHTGKEDEADGKMRGDEPLDELDMFPADLRAALDVFVQQAMELGPDASLDELNAVLSASTGDYNLRPQEELGGLSPDQVERLIRPEWGSVRHAIQLDQSVPYEELAISRTLDDARLVLTMLGEHPGGVKATQKGMLTRAFVNAFRERMRPRGSAIEERYQRRDAERVLNEADVRSLHVARLLLGLAGLVKKRQGVFSRTRRGEQLTGTARAGELFTALVLAQFTRMDLAYLDRCPPIPEFQFTLGYSLYQLAHSDGEWRTARDWVERVMLPVVYTELPRDYDVDYAQIIMETRFLRPLEGFGLVEVREFPREPGAYSGRREWRATKLLGQAVKFDFDGGEE